jgi:hypothetical protein
MSEVIDLADWRARRGRTAPPAVAPAPLPVRPSRRLRLALTLLLSLPLVVALLSVAA